MTHTNTNAATGDRGDRQVNGSEQEEPALTSETHGQSQVSACEQCSAPLRRRLKSGGEPQRFCSARCRVANSRLLRSELNSKINGAERADSGKTATGSLKIIFRPAGHPPTVTRTAPLNLLGGGSWRWPNSSRIDAKTLDKVRWCEVGGERIDWPSSDGGGAR